MATLASSLAKAGLLGADSWLLPSLLRFEGLGVFG